MPEPTCVARTRRLPVSEQKQHLRSLHTAGTQDSVLYHASSASSAKGLLCTYSIILDLDESGWQGRLLGICKPFLIDVAAAAVALAPGCDPAVAANAARITAELSREEAKFAQTLETGVSAYAKLVYNYICESILEEVLNLQSTEQK